MCPSKVTFCLQCIKDVPSASRVGWAVSEAGQTDRRLGRAGLGLGSGCAGCRCQLMSRNEMFNIPVENCFSAAASGFVSSRRGRAHAPWQWLFSECCCCCCHATIWPTFQWGITASGLTAGALSWPPNGLRLQVASQVQQLPSALAPVRCPSTKLVASHPITCCIYSAPTKAKQLGTSHSRPPPALQIVSANSSSSSREMQNYDNCICSKPNANVVQQSLLPQQHPAWQEVLLVGVLFCPVPSVRLLPAPFCKCQS